MQAFIAKENLVFIQLKAERHRSSVIRSRQQRGGGLIAVHILLIMIHPTDNES